MGEEHAQTGANPYSAGLADAAGNDEPEFHDADGSVVEGGVSVNGNKKLGTDRYAQTAARAKVSPSD